MSLQRISALTVPEGDGVTVRRLMPVHGLRNFDVVMTKQAMWHWI